MARIDIPTGDGLERSRMWLLQPDVAKGIGIAGSALYKRVSLDTRVREVARMRIAQINQCHI
jgi:alkylhydroperoxidase family enzyme